MMARSCASGARGATAGCACAMDDMTAAGRPSAACDGSGMAAACITIDGCACTEPGADSPYRTEDEVLQVLYKSASTGLEFASDMRLGRPLGTFERPRPNWAEAYRSGLSLQLLQAAVRGAGGLAVRLAADDATLQARLKAELEDFHDSADALGDPVFASVAEPTGRFRVESLQTDLQEVREVVQGELGPALGVSAGFNSMDGD